MMDIILLISGVLLLVVQFLMVVRFFSMADDLTGIRSELKALRQTVADEVNRQFRKDHPLKEEEPRIQPDLWLKCPHCHKAISRASLRYGRNKCPHCRGLFHEPPHTAPDLGADPATPEPEPEGVPCPNCAHLMRPDYIRKGDNICPSCKVEFVVE
jgi:uncharacterized CHY-type Zn-finger protein